MMEYQYPGFRFYPMEEELVSFYLYNKLEGRRPDIDRVIPVVDIYDHHPSHLPQLAGEYCRGDPEQWFFFLPIQDREARGGRPNRLTSEGYWKATGSPGLVYSSQSRIIGVRKTMVFYQGRAPNGEKTPWKMNEYRAIDGLASSSSPPKLRQELSLCRVYKGSKSVRAFDRRPTSTGAAGSVHQVDQETFGGREVNQLPITSHHHPSPSTLAEGPRSSISSSSSSEDDGPVDPSSETVDDSTDHQSNINMDFENKPMWDWEQLNWLY